MLFGVLIRSFHQEAVLNYLYPKLFSPTESGFYFTDCFLRVALIAGEK